MNPGDAALGGLMFAAIVLSAIYLVWLLLSPLVAGSVDGERDEWLSDSFRGPNRLVYLAGRKSAAGKRSRIEARNQARRIK